MWRLPVNVLLGALAAGGIILGFLLRLVMGERPRGVDAGPSRMIGLRGKAVTEVACEGRVMVQGEYWWARARTDRRRRERTCRRHRRDDARSRAVAGQVHDSPPCFRRRRA
jgi:membrane protein implicated in regulation of membrane protease activity